MPHVNYLQEHMGSATLSPTGPFEAGSYASLTLTYTAGKFGIDDTGQIKVCWRGTSDMATPQFKEPEAPHFCSVEASNGAVLEFRVDRVNIRPWVNTLFIRVNRGFLRENDTITIRFGDRRFGSPGLRLQSNCESTFEFKVFVDAFATYEFTELTRSPEIALIPGPAQAWKAILPTLAIAGEPFRLAIVAEDRWGNPTGNISVKKLRIRYESADCWASRPDCSHKSGVTACAERTQGRPAKPCNPVHFRRTKSSVVPRQSLICGRISHFAPILGRLAWSKRGDDRY